MSVSVQQMLEADFNEDTQARFGKEVLAHPTKRKSPVTRRSTRCFEPRSSLMTPRGASNPPAAAVLRTQMLCFAVKEPRRASCLAAKNINGLLTSRRATVTAHAGAHIAAQSKAVAPTTAQKGVYPQCRTTNHSDRCHILTAELLFPNGSDAFVRARLDGCTQLQ